MATRTKPARLDADRSAKPLTRIVQRVDAIKCVRVGALSAGPLYHEAEDGSRTPLAASPNPTEAQLEALHLLSIEPRSSWAFGSTTVNVLVRRGWAERVVRENTYAGRTYRSTSLRITDAGRAALAGAGR